MTSEASSGPEGSVKREVTIDANSEIRQIGQLHVHLSRRDVSVNGCSVSIGSRAFEIFELLIRAEGALVSKDEIIAKVWPRTIVEENNIQVHISTIRKLLGPNREMIQTVPGRGYRLVCANVPPGLTSSAPMLCPTPVAIASPHNLPALSSRLIGRDDAIADIGRALRSTRLLTIVAAGGMGKTRLAIEVARELTREFPDGIYFLSFATVNDARGVIDEFIKVTARAGKGVALDGTTSVMTARNQDEASKAGAPLTHGRHVLPDDGPVPPVLSMQPFMNRKVLFVLDNCEHVLDAATALADTILSKTSMACILANSREALRTSGEQLYRLPPLVMPDVGTDDAKALQCSAVTLFFLRAHATEPAFGQTPGSIAQVSAICRRLDGMPLAIELAAARAAVLGADEVSRSLNDRFATLNGGHRTALPRHQTLKATLDWSHDLLNESERLVLRRLGVFADSFTLESATAIINHADISADDVATLVASLANKSLIVVIQTASITRYRLLETTRAYAMQKLDDNGEYRQVAANHARLVHKLIGVPSTESDATSRWVADGVSGADLRNAREALTWAFSSTGDSWVAVHLAAAGAPLFFHAAMIEECGEWARKGLDALDVLTPLGEDVDVQQQEALEGHTTLRLRLLTALAAAHLYVEGPRETSHELWKQALSLAVRASHDEFKACAMWGMWQAAQYAGACKDALTYAEHFRETAREASHIGHQALGHGLLGVAHHFMGDQQTAHQRLIETAGQHDNTDRPLSFFGYSLDCRIVTRATLARVLWLKGERREATDIAEQAMQQAARSANDMSMAYVLVEALIPLSLLADEWVQVKVYSDVLKPIAVRSGSRIWEALSRCFVTVIDFHDQPGFANLVAFTTALASLASTGFLAHEAFFSGLYAQALNRMGDRTAALERLDRALERSMETGAFWFDSELWRLKGEMLLHSGDRQSFTRQTEDDERDGRACIREAMLIAERQHAHFFVARAKRSLASALASCPEKAPDLRKRQPFGEQSPEREKQAFI